MMMQKWVKHIVIGLVATVLCALVYSPSRTLPPLEIMAYGLALSALSSLLADKIREKFAPQPAIDIDSLFNEGDQDE